MTDRTGLDERVEALLSRGHDIQTIAERLCLSRDAASMRAVGVRSRQRAALPLEQRVAMARAKLAAGVSLKSAALFLGMTARQLDLALWDALGGGK